MTRRTRSRPPTPPICGSSRSTGARRASSSMLTAPSENTPASWIQLGLHHASAVLAEDENAEALFQAALSAEVNRWPYQRARLLLAYGAWLRASGGWRSRGR